MRPLPVTICLLLSIACANASAQSGEALEMSPEARDAAWSSADAAREAALFSDAVPGAAQNRSLGDGAAAVDLVFRGRVTAQDYHYDEAGRPYTHTSVQIDDVLKGNYAGKTLTVVQEGGPVKNSTDNIVIVSDAQYFTPGEDELLFVNLDLNNAHATQRVEIVQRFRVYDGQVFGVDGHGVLLQAAPGAGQTIAWSSDRHPARRFREFQIGSHTLTKQFREPGAEHAPGESVPPQARAATPGYQSSVDVDSFSASISAAVAASNGD